VWGERGGKSHDRERGLVGEGVAMTERKGGKRRRERERERERGGSRERGAGGRRAPRVCEREGEPRE